MKRTTITAAIAAMFLMPACGGEDSGPLDGVDAIVFIQKIPRADGMGDIFRNLSYEPGARLVKLSPPTADGELEVLCCDDQGLAGVDINSYDLNFDATEIVFSARTEGDTNYGLFVLDLQTLEVEQLPTDPTEHYIYPTFVPGDRIMYNTTKSAIEGAPQHVDEYERGRTTQIASMSRSGTDVAFRAQNLSHMVHGSVLHDGRIITTKWNHVNGNNAGQLIIHNPDGTNEREAFGREGTGVTNSYYKAVEIEPGRVLAVGSSRNRTLQSGTLLDIRLGLDDGEGGYTKEMSEANASYQILTPGVPLGNEDSSATVGRYFSAYPLNTKEKPDLLVSWSDGPVQSETLAAAGLTAMFGVYLLNTSTNARKPIYDDPAYWEVFPRPLAPRFAPREIPQQASDPLAGDGVLLGIMDVPNSSLVDFSGEEIYGVRFIEGYSSEEGFPRTFGSARTEGAAHLGTAVMQPDGSALARLPAFIPIRQQVINAYGLAVGDEPVWIGGEPGRARVCGGCHENRTASAIIDPGLTQAAVLGPVDMMSDIPKFYPDGSYGRISSPDVLTADPGTSIGLVDIPWGGEQFGGYTGLQRIFDDKCISCHEGTPGPANPSLTITNPNTLATQTLVFDLRGQLLQIDAGDEMIPAFPASHVSLVGLDMQAVEQAGLVLEGDMQVYVEPGSAIESEVIRLLNPPRFFNQYEGQPASPGLMEFNIDMNDRYFPRSGNMHENLLTAEEYYMLILLIDMNGQAYSRSNNPNAGLYQ